MASPRPHPFASRRGARLRGPQARGMGCNPMQAPAGLWARTASLVDLSRGFVEQRREIVDLLSSADKSTGHALKHCRLQADAASSAETRRVLSNATAASGARRGKAPKAEGIRKGRRHPKDRSEAEPVVARCPQGSRTSSLPLPTTFPSTLLWSILHGLCRLGLALIGLGLQ